MPEPRGRREMSLAAFRGRLHRCSVRPCQWRGTTPATENAIDVFIQARLDEKGIRPSPEADQRTLLRRLYLDLIGLPPTPEQTEAFLADKAPKAYERLVDQLLASPHYGEKWSRHWLDLARYADSEGGVHDFPRRFAWRYRDWVINAFNADMPFDRFTV